MIEQDEIIEYNSLNEIRLRKELLRKDIQADDAKIKVLWKSLFTKPEALSKNASASKRLSSMMKIGAGALMVLYLHGNFITSSREKDKA